MYTDVAGEALQQVDGQTTTTREIAEFFNTVAASGAQPRLGTVSGTCRFDIAGAGTYRVDVKDGVPTVTHDDTDSAPADCVVALGAEDFTRLVRREGNLNVFAALVQGCVAVSGDVSLAAQMLFSYTPKPVGVQSR